MGTDRCHVEPNLVHLRARVEFDMVEFALGGHSFLEELLDDHISNALQGAIVLILLYVDVEDATLGRVVVLHGLQALESEFNWLRVLPTSRAENLFKDVALQALKHSFRSIKARLFLQVEHQYSKVQSWRLSKLASCNTIVLAPND